MRRVINWSMDDGFSSEDEFQQEIILDDMQHMQEQLPPHHVEHVETTLNNKKYSLHPDIITGWIPRIQLSNPIPLTFHHQFTDDLLNSILSHKSTLIQLCYLGPRYPTTYQAWYYSTIDFPYKHIKPPINIKNTTRLFSGQYFTANSQQFLQFDSFYQSANLDMAFKVSLWVFQVGECKYELFMRVDSNTHGHLQWYNFKVRRLKQGTKYKFSICNFQKHNLLYSKNMKPYIFSRKKMEAEKIGWMQDGQNVKFVRKSSKVTKQLDQQQPSYLCREDYRSYMLSFEYLCRYDDDQLQVAYCIPYTYSQLKQFLSSIECVSESMYQDSLDANIMRISKLTTSLGGNEIPYLTITNHVDEAIICEKENKRLNKKMIMVTARIHPGQSNGSLMVEGFIRFLISGSKSAQILRDRIVFKIIPMLNPDGVILGNYRTGLAGRDLNRQFIDPDKIIYPQIYSLKELIRVSKQFYGRNLFMFLDFHGHSVKKNIFMYGPQFSITHKNYYECRIFPKLISLKTDMFRYYSCSFKVSQIKQSTARAVLFRTFNIPFTYTIQASNGCYFSKELFKDVGFQDKQWSIFGDKVAEALYDYLEICIQLQNKRIERINQKKTTYKKNTTKESLNQKSFNILNNRKIIKSSFSVNRKADSSEQSSILNMLSKLEDGNMLSIIQQIQKQDQYRVANHDLDDQIVEGSSDAQSDSNNLDSKQMQNLINHIKNKTPLRNKQSKNELGRVNSQAQQKQRATTQVCGQKLFANKSKLYSIKKSYLFKKSHITQTYSPKKEQKGIPAKVLNFNFELTAIPLKNNQSRMIIDRRLSSKKINFSGLIQDQKIPQSRKIICKSYELHQTNHRSFLSMHRQIKKKQFRSNKNPDLLIQNIQGKKIFVSKQ